MIQPNELKLDLPMSLSNGVISTTGQVWDMLVASRDGNLQKVKELADSCPELVYAQYNYTPPIHFAVREGHVDLVNYLLERGAYDPGYRTYPFSDSLATIAEERGYQNIVRVLEQYNNEPLRQQFKGDNGAIDYGRTSEQQEFEDAVHTNDLEKTASILEQYPEFALDETFFWGEGILMKPVQHQEWELVELLLRHGARVPDILKWTQAYYFKFYDSAALIMQNGMNPNVMSWHHVTILHDMAQKGNIPKAELLIQYGAAIDPIEEEYQSTPLGMAARWGNAEMVEFLLKHGADPNKSGAAWSTPLAWARGKRHNDIGEMLRKAGAR
ncbi:MAG: ankyrin repeat domain-containing protein [Bacteroidota bacterium]